MNKSEVYQALCSSMDEQINKLRSLLDDLMEGGSGDTKSSAGDKHETGRAMAQLEQEKLSKQLMELLKQQETIRKIDPSVKSKTVQLGSLVKTNKGWYFFSTSLGIISIGKESVFCLSIQAPIAQLMLGKKDKDSVKFNGQEVCIDAII